MKAVNAIATHHGDSWPARQPPCWHSGDSCGSVPCAPPVNYAACSFVHSSCTCEVYPLWREGKRLPCWRIKSGGPERLHLNYCTREWRWGVSVATQASEGLSSRLAGYHFASICSKIMRVASYKDKRTPNRFIFLLSTENKLHLTHLFHIQIWNTFFMF